MDLILVPWNFLADKDNLIHTPHFPGKEQTSPKSQFKGGYAAIISFHIHFYLSLWQEWN